MVPTCRSSSASQSLLCKNVGNSSFSLVDSSRAKYRSGLYLCIHFSRHQILSCLGCQGTYVPKQELRLVTNCTKPKSADPVGSLTCVLARVECQRYNKLSSLVGKPDVQRKELVLKGVMTVKRRSARSESDVDLRLVRLDFVWRWDTWASTDPKSLGHGQPARHLFRGRVHLFYEVAV